MTAALRRSFSSLAVPNYRLFYSGQIVSASGTWMQFVAEAWLVIKLTGNGTDVGITTGLQFLPLLLIGAYGGVLADRFDKRKVLMITQPLLALPAIMMWALTFGGVIEVWMVWTLVLLRGCVTAFDNPARQSFVSELVGPDQVVNAISLNSVMVSVARIVGPALAAAIIATAGVSTCFLINAATFGAMSLVLSRLDTTKLFRSARTQRAPGQIRDALRIVRSRSELWVPLAMMAVVGTFAYNFPTVLPIMAKFVWNGNATTYALLFASLAAGSVVGGLTSAHRGTVSTRLLIVSSTLFGVFGLAAAFAPSLPLQMLLLFPTGITSATFMASCNSSLQIAAEGPLRGRVMSLFGIVFLGSTPIGAPIVGTLSQLTSARWGMAVGGVACFVAAGGALIAYRRGLGRRSAVAEAGGAPVGQAARAA